MKDKGEGQGKRVCVCGGGEFSGMSEKIQKICNVSVAAAVWRSPYMSVRVGISVAHSLIKLLVYGVLSY